MKEGLLNVLPAKTLKTLLTDVTESIADVLSHTFGPYGQNAIIQTTGSVYATKDGWNVMQLLRVCDKKGENAITINALKKLIQDVAQATLLNAGDGTTESTMGAAYLNRRVSNYLKEHKMDTRMIETALRSACEKIVEELQLSATMVDDHNMAEVIHQIALISTNWDEEISDIIRDIYCTTKNPIIKVEDSGTLETTVEYIEGYDIVGHLELPNFYLTSPASGLFETKIPLILTFGSAVHKDKLQSFILMGDLLRQNNQALVLVAPSYDADFLSTLKALNAGRIQQGLPIINTVPFKYYAKTDIDRDCVEDFAMATGGILLTNEYPEVEQAFGALAEIITERKNEERPFVKGENKKPSVSSKNKTAKQEEVINKCIQVLTKIGGTCNKLVATDKYILASGLSAKNEVEFERRKKNLENELEMKYKQYMAESSLTEMIRIKRLRLGKMQCNMGVIKVGGFGAAHLKAKRDSIDDATRSCEVAYQDGYIMDGGIAIPIAIKHCIAKYENTANWTTEDRFEFDFLKMFQDAFLEVATVLFNNKFDDLDKSTDLVNTCLEKEECYDLLTDQFTDELITPVAVCREVLNGCLRLVLINATSNQFVFMNEDDLIRAIQIGSSNYQNEEEE